MKIKLGKPLALVSAACGITSAYMIEKLCDQVETETQAEEAAKEIGKASLEVMAIAPTILLAAGLWMAGPEIEVGGKKLEDEPEPIISKLDKKVEEAKAEMKKQTEEMTKKYMAEISQKIESSVSQIIKNVLDDALVNVGATAASDTNQSIPVASKVDEDDDDDDEYI